MKRVAIIGAGFCGLATAWHLLNQASANQAIEVVIIDAKGVGAGASGIAAGLLHPYAGAHAKLNRLGKEGIQATTELLDIASEAIGHPVAIAKGILRLAMSVDQQADFTNSALKYSDDIDWLTSEQCKDLYPLLEKFPGIWINNGKIVDSPLYLKGLWKACEKKGALLEIQTVTSLNELKHYDAIVIAAGANILLFPELSTLPLTFVKGQVLELEWPQNLPKLSFALNSQAYVIMNEKQNTCLVGATFEKKYANSQPDIKIAQEDILPKAIAMLPGLESAYVIQCFAGLRVVTANHMPLIKKIGKKQWVLTGMGSKGLLYHALSAKQIASEILKEI